MGVGRRHPRLTVVVDPGGVLTTTAPTVTTSAYHVALLCCTSTRRSHSRAAHRLRRIGLSRRVARDTSTSPHHRRGHEITYGRLYRRDSPNDGKSTSVIGRFDAFAQLEVNFSMCGPSERESHPDELMTPGWNRRSTVTPTNIAQISWQDSIRPKDNGLISVIVIKE
ncbi:hypothetical protein ALC57_10020 [Trachymyrmex cornetzi]|uniref:Uncharacterized protein n=1 Tax=Trachymyrmex cornetzi TaxID=471704 RepID=A0A195DXV0_9HYME|nr:hypothetical protein ALC57_10020 [Trachymyrmex cornetzi]